MSPLRWFDSIQKRAALLLLALFALVILYSAATIAGIVDQKRDTQVINLAGRQRMLVQQMTRVALERHLGYPAATQAEIQRLVDTFEQTQQALRFGGPAPYQPGVSITLKGAGQADILNLMQAEAGNWESFRQALSRLASLPRDDPGFAPALDQVEALSPTLVDQADQVVRLFESASLAKWARLRAVTVAFLASVLVLLGAFALVMRRYVIQPLSALAQNAGRIGAGDLQTPLQPTGLAEIRNLASSFDLMRSQLQASRLELVDWATGMEKRVAERTRELEALYQVNYEISSRLDLQHVLQTVTEKARDLLGAEVATLCMLDEQNQVLRLTASSGPEGAIAGQESGGGKGETRQLLFSSRAQLRSGSCRGGCGILAEQYRASHLAAPLKVGEHIIGALCVSSSRAGQFGGPAADLLTRLANSAAIALENARLYAQAERVAALEERQRIAADIHDGLGQTLAYLGLVIDQAADQIEAGELPRVSANLEEARLRIGQAVAQTRQAIASLIAAEAQLQSLPAQLRQLVAEFSSASHEGEQLPELHFEQTGGDLFPMNPSAMNQVWHICREALINARQHAHASRITVSLVAQDGAATLTITDDGCGFDLEGLPEDASQHFGLRVMRARAEHLQGDLEITSAPGQGTRVCLRWPDANQILRVTHAADTRIAG